MFGLLTKSKRPSETAHLNTVQPLSSKPPTDWYEVALCVRDDDTGELVIKKIRSALEPEITFTEDDGVEPAQEYTAIYRRVRFDEEEGIFFGAWSDTTGWQKPTVHSK